MSLAERVKTKFPNLVTEAFVSGGLEMTGRSTAPTDVPRSQDCGRETVVARKEGLKALALSLKTDLEFQFNMLMDLFAVDYLHWEEKEKRFEVVYNVYSLKKNHRLFVKVPLTEESPEVDSVVSVWPAAEWLEREVWDMMGIVFKGHPNLKRILMYEGFKGHPLRKDYRYNLRQPIIGPGDDGALHGPDRRATSEDLGPVN